MSTKNFPSPHCHIQSLDSASTPEAFAAREVELGTGALTCTDHGFMGAIPKVYDLARKNGLTPILGVEAYMRDDDCPILAQHGIVKTNDPEYQRRIQSKDPDVRARARQTTAFYKKYFHFCVHCQDQAAYDALSKEMSRSFEERAEKHGGEEKPLFNWEQIETLGAHNVTMTSGCLIGVVQAHLGIKGDYRPDLARAYYEKMRAMVKPGNFYVEIFPHRCTHYWDQGVYLTLADGRQLKYYNGKTLKVRTEGKAGFNEELKAIELARGWEAALRAGAAVTLVAVKHERQWQEMEPVLVTGVRAVQDFIPNECLPHAPDGDVQLQANRFVLELAQRYGDPVIISDDAHFTRREEKSVQDSKLTSGGHSWKFHNCYHRQSGDEVMRYFRDVFGASERDVEAWIDNAYGFRDKFKDFKLQYKTQLPTSYFPKDTLGHLGTLIKKHGRMNWRDPAMVERLKTEVQLLHRNGTIDLLPYFFLAEYAIDDAYTQAGKLTGVGRGSSGGVLIDYLLSVTHMNPLQYDLSLDRFLTLDRIASGKLPDIDMDFPERETLLDPRDGWLAKKFGARAAAISTRTGLHLRSSIKDVMRAKYGYVSEDIEQICKALPTPPQGIQDRDFVFGYTSEDGKEVRGLIEENEALQLFVRDHPQEWEVVKQMLGITKGHSRHASGWVIADVPIGELMPVFNVSGVRATQYDMAGVEACGGLKMDFLGLNNLLYIQDCIKLVQERHGGGRPQEPTTVDGIKVWPHQQVPHKGQTYFVWNLPPEQAVFRDICEGRTETVFQLSTPAAKKWLREFNFWRDEEAGVKAIASIEDIANFTSLDRPGPLDAYVQGPDGTRYNMLQEYARRARGEPAIGEVPALTALLPKEFGILVTQEGLERVYRELTGCSGAEATNFRANVAKKKMKAVEQAYGGFMERAGAKLGTEQARQVWDQLVTFGQYGFNKSHAVAYAITAYTCAWFKHHYNLEWWTAVLRNSKKEDILEKHWEYCRHMLAPPDITRSSTTFEISGDRIVMPLGFIKGVGEGASAELAAGAPYENIEDFVRKIFDRRRANGKPAYHKVTGEPILVKKTGQQQWRLGTTALNGGVVKKLITAGVMDSLFGPNDLLFDKLNAYENAVEKIGGKKLSAKQRTARHYVKLDAMQRHQLRRQYLPIGTDTVLPLVITSGNVEGLTETRNSRGQRQWRLRPQGGLATALAEADIRIGPDGIQVIDDSQIPLFNELPMNRGNKALVGVFVYIMTSSSFPIKRNGSTAWKLHVDVGTGGQVVEIVQWARYKQKMPANPQPEAGSIAFAVLSRHDNRPATAELLYVVSPAVKTPSEEANESTDE